MARKTKNKPQKKGETLYPNFASLEEARSFGYTRYCRLEEYFTDVEFTVDLQKRSLSVDRKLYDEVSAIAKKKRIPAEKLVNRWIKEKLRSAA